MQLIHDRVEDHFFIRAIRSDAVVIIDRELRSSFLIAPDRVIEAWPAGSIEALDAAAVQGILDQEPEVVILGTGSRQQFPDKSLLLPLLRQGIGVEVMDNSAAARTYNLLAGEGRKVVAGFILPG